MQAGSSSPVSPGRSLLDGAQGASAVPEMASEPVVATSSGAAGGGRAAAYATPRPPTRTGAGQARQGRIVIDVGIDRVRLQQELGAKVFGGADFVPFQVLPYLPQ